MAIRIGLVGYGLGGQMFHAPYIHASTECDLVGIVTRAPERVRAAQADNPGVPLHASLGDLIDAGVDAVVISTPAATRHELVLEALARGAHVVADKPFAPSATLGRELVDASDRAKLLLNVFHNRRFDSDIVTARAVIDSGKLGDITRLDLRCDQDDPGTFDGGHEGGLLRDLGSHVVDQALYLLGPARFVSAQLDWAKTDAGSADSGFVISIEHECGAHSHVSSSKLNYLSSRELRVHGRCGSYRSDFTDVQFEALRAGLRPAGQRATWGYEDKARWGVLSTASECRVVPSLQGDYAAYYDAFAAAVKSGGTGPVPAREGVAVLEVLDAARLSAAEHRTVAL
ncbi:putative dehydrogenase [Microcella alkaliphila]|uniref:Putative dehydrogenase n=1 Tax=Microcella alkaliphila TaxID=279828 RepID=A0A4Q7TZH5_9MICO|nr:Gfo/Idh/MocA family oxidoreductase [Microcella alkaliphila]RZT66505.1 putative dehydrogenase [Microcella alkaliphila]